MNLDPYKTLGVDKKAGPDAIKSAYRKLARKYHPDVNPGDKAAEEKFKELSMAYDILSDPAKKAEYDNMGSAFFERGAGGGYQQNFNFEDFRMDDLFADLFGGGGGAKSRGGRRGGVFSFGGDAGNIFGGFGGGFGDSGPARGADLEHELVLDFKDAAQGTQITLELDSPETCPGCGGQGVVSNGGGVRPCAQCHGRGRVARQRAIKARIPAGVADGQKIRLRGKGRPGERGGPPGDMNLVVRIRPDKVFTRDGLNLNLERSVSVYQALLGAQIEVPTLSGRATLKVPPLTQNGSRFRLKGLGVDTGKRIGDLHVTIKVVLPSRLSDEARELVGRLAEAAPVDLEGV
jgi:molecular chaperone DnaJ